MKEQTKAQKEEKKYRRTIFFALFTLFATPITTVFFVPPDSQLPIYASAVVTLFWVLVLCIFFWKMVIEIMIEKDHTMKKMEEMVKNGSGEMVKHRMVANLDLLRPARHEELMWALSFAANGNKKALQKMKWRANWAGLKYLIWVSVLLLLIPFVALGFIQPMIIVGWIGLFFVYLPYSYLRDLILNDEYVYESAAMGLTLDKSTLTATGTRYGRTVNVRFMDHACETTIRADAGIFTATVKNKTFQTDSSSPRIKELLRTLSSKKRASLWYRTEITSDGRSIRFLRHFNSKSQNTMEADYWLCDVWLAEWFASGRAL